MHPFAFTRATPQVQKQLYRLLCRDTREPTDDMDRRADRNMHDPGVRTALFWRDKALIR
jgi:hypothetical protein